MRKRKHKKTIAKLGLLFTIILFLLASISMSYAHWTDTITIQGTVTTGTWEWEETAWARMYDYPNNFTHPFPGDNWATYIIYNETQVTFYLYADQEYRVGELHVWKDNSNLLYVKYVLDAGYTMSVSHLHVNTSLDENDIPQNAGGPIPGQFDYKVEDHDRVTEYTYEIPWDQSWNGVDLYILAHAVIWGIYL
jgi:hypothetical protein